MDPPKPPSVQLCVIPEPGDGSLLRDKLVDLDAHADHPELLLQQPRVLPAQHAGRGHENVERERLAVLVADAVAVVVTPAVGIQAPPRLRRVVGQLPNLGIPDPHERRDGTRRHLPEVTEGALHQARAIDCHCERSAHFAIGENRMRLRRVAAGAQIEGQVGVDVSAERVERELRRRPRALHVLRRHELLAHVGLIRDHLRHGDLQIGREPPNQAANPRPAQKERRIGLEFDRLRRLPADKAVWPAAHRRSPERRRLPLVPGHRAQQVRRQDAHVVDRIVEHLGIPLAEPKYRGERVALRDAGDAPQLGAERGSDRGVLVGVEREFHVGGAHALAVLPARARIDMEHQRERPVPLPPLSEQRLKVFVADGVRGHTDVGELQEQLLAQVSRHHIIGRRRQ